MAIYAKTFEIYKIVGAPPGKDFSWKLLNEKGLEIAKSEIGFPCEEIRGVIGILRKEIANTVVRWKEPELNPHKAEEDNCGKDDGGRPGS